MTLKQLSEVHVKLIARSGRLAKNVCRVVMLTAITKKITPPSNALLTVQPVSDNAGHMVMNIYY